MYDVRAPNFKNKHVVAFRAKDLNFRDGLNPGTPLQIIPKLKIKPNVDYIALQQLVAPNAGADNVYLFADKCRVKVSCTMVFNDMFLNQREEGRLNNEEVSFY